MAERITDQSHDALDAVLELRSEWLAHQGTGSPAVKRQALHDLEDQGAAEQRVRSDYTGRYPMELLQNAHDACADGGIRGFVHFVVSDHALLVANQGVRFDESRILSLVRLGASEKAVSRHVRHMIGYKGVGFTSVFEMCDTPQIVSGSVGFSFDGKRAKSLVRSALGKEPRQIPVRAFPFPMDLDELDDDAETVERLLGEGAVTVVRLPFRSASGADVARDLREALAPDVLLFMPSIDQLTISTSTESITWTCEDRRSIGSGRVKRLVASTGEQREWLTLTRSVKCDPDLLDALDDPLWRDIRELHTTVALPWKRGVDASVGRQHLHVYYPTDDRLDRAVLVHGDFYVKSDRRRIETEKAGGAVSRIVAEAAAKGVGELAESIASTQGNHLLQALSPSYLSDGYGSLISDLIDEELRSRRIVRTIVGTTRRPAETSIFLPDDDLRRSDVRALTDMLRKKRDLVRLDDQHGVEEYLLQLGVQELEPGDIAASVELRRRSGYDDDLATLDHWLDSLAMADYVSALSVLKSRPIVRDRHGRFRPASETVLRIGELPELPSRLKRFEVHQPRRRDARELLARLGVTELTAESAIALVLGAIERKSFVNDADWSEVLRFVQALWRKQRKVIEKRAGRLGSVRVPARTRSGHVVSWKRSDSVYFPKAWTGSDDLERLYGGFGEAEFLVEPPSRRGRESLYRFYSLLGVAGSIREESLRFEWRPGHGLWDRPDTHAWMKWVGYEDGRACPDHPNSEHCSIPVLDRLDLVLDELTPAQARSLANLLVQEAEPYGSDAQVMCSAQAHRRTPRKSLPGFQHWLLNNWYEWVPTVDLDQTSTLALPRASWRADRANADLLIPKSRLPSGVSAALALPSPQAPSVEALEELLRLLAERNPDLAASDGPAKETARWAQRKLESAVRRMKSREVTFQFVADHDGQPVWDSGPLLSDLPSDITAPGLNVIPSSNRNLGRVYGLTNASTAVKIRVISGERRRDRPLLTDDDKASILAVLTARDVDVRRIATRLAALEQRAASDLAIEVSFRRRVSRTSLSSYLEIKRDKRGALRGGTLHWIGGTPIKTLRLASDLAAYLDVDEHSETLALLLRDPADVLEREGITTREFADAARALARTRRAIRADGDEEVEEDEPHAEVEVEEEDEEPPHGGEPTSTEHLDRPSARGVSPHDSRSATGSRSVLEAGTRQPGAERPEKLISAEVSFGDARPGAQRSRRRQRDGDGRGSTGRPAAERGVSFLSDADGESEIRAMEIATRYGQLLGARVDDVHSAKKGWDLEFFFPDGSWRPVEVKGTRWGGTFPITRNERRKAREYADYELVWVANLADPSRSCLRSFPRFGAKLDDNVLDPLSWEVAEWDALAYEERSIRELPA